MSTSLKKAVRAGRAVGKSKGLAEEGEKRREGGVSIIKIHYVIIEPFIMYRITDANKNIKKSHIREQVRQSPKPKLFCSLVFLLDYDTINFYNLPSQSPQSWQRERHELNKHSRSWSFSSSHQTTSLICKGQKDQHPKLVNVCWTHQLPSAE